MIAGAVKYFRFTIDYILYELSYVNLVMLSATIPDYSYDKDRKKGDGVTINGDDPSNNALILKALGY